jgi:hypothetical protein
MEPILNTVKYQQESIASELVLDLKALESHFCGRFVARHCRLEAFRRGRVQWSEKEHGVLRKREMFKDLLGTETQKMDSGVALKGSEAAKKDESEVCLKWMGSERLWFCIDFILACVGGSALDYD